jgi:hypothetical protein
MIPHYYDYGTDNKHRQQHASSCRKWMGMLGCSRNTLLWSITLFPAVWFLNMNFYNGNGFVQKVQPSEDAKSPPIRNNGGPLEVADRDERDNDNEQLSC